MVTDNDWDFDAVRGKYEEYLGEKKTGVSALMRKYEERAHAAPKVLTATPSDLLRENGTEALNEIFGKSHYKDEGLLKFMRENKTASAFKIFNTEREIEFPGYILEAIGATCEQ